jgi:hypothetical protein
MFQRNQRRYHVKKLEYLQRHALDMAYLAPPGQEDTPRTFKRRVYSTLQMLAMAERGTRNMRVTQIRCSTNWTLVWKNLHSAWVSEQSKSTWYTVIHYIIPNNERLYTIRLVESDRCRHCGRHTLQHVLTDCNEGAVIWTRTSLGCSERTRAVFPHTGASGPNFSSGHHSVTGRYYGYWHIG